MKKLALLLPVAGIFIFSCVNNTEDNTGEPQENVSYSQQIQPIFTSRCIACHGSESGLNLSSWTALMNSVGNQYGENIVVPGDAEASPLFEKVQSNNPELGQRMPLNSAPLSGNQIELIRAWINEGAENN